VRSFVGRHDVGRQGPRAEQAAQRAVHRGVADVLEPGVAQPAHDVVPVRVLVGDDRQHREIEHPLEQLARVLLFALLPFPE
jgi:hypothetical protein